MIPTVYRETVQNPLSGNSETFYFLSLYPRGFVRLDDGQVFGSKGLTEKMEKVGTIDTLLNLPERA